MARGKIVGLIKVNTYITQRILTVDIPEQTETPLGECPYHHVIGKKRLGLVKMVIAKSRLRKNDRKNPLLLELSSPSANSYTFREWNCYRKDKISSLLPGLAIKCM